MAVHTIVMPDRELSGPVRSIVWDDQAGTVTGEHYDVPWMQRILAKPTPVVLDRVAGSATLRDPGHDPADFLFLLSEAFWPVLDEPLRSTLPPVFDGVEPTRFKAFPLAPDEVA